MNYFSYIFFFNYTQGHQISQGKKKFRSLNGAQARDSLDYCSNACSIWSTLILPKKYYQDPLSNYSLYFIEHPL